MNDAPRSPTPLEWACLLAGVFFSLQYGWVLDDAFVYFRYIDNLLILDHGLVYNRGEFVEGYTSPLWLLVLTGCQLLSIEYWLAIRLLAVGCFTGFWWFLVVLNRELSPPGTPRLDFPLIALSCNYAVACYFTSGVESPLVQWTAVAYALFLVQPRRTLPLILVGLSPLTRPELMLTCGLVFAWMWFRDRRASLRLVAVATLSFVPWMLFRIDYYADLLPNTYYLKDLADVGQGLIYLHQTLASYWTYPILVVFAALATMLWLRRDQLHVGPRAVMVALSVILAAYFVRIGGDPRHYRYLAFSYCLGFAALAGLAERGIAAYAPHLRSGPLQAGGLVIAVLVAACYPPQLSGHPLLGPVEHHTVEKIKDAAHHRDHNDLRVDPWSLEPRFDQSDRYAEYLATREPGKPYRGNMSQSWCYHAYIKFDIRVVHSAGLTEAYLARVDVPPDRPGHKSGLVPLARQLARLRAKVNRKHGTYREAVERGLAPDWIERNLATMELIERKEKNEHRFFENLGLAFTPVGRITP